MNRAAGTHSGEYKYVEGTNVDWFVDPLTSMIIVASNRTQAQTDILVLDPNTFSVLAQSKLFGASRDGPAVAKKADHTALDRMDCSTLRLWVAKDDSTDSVQGDVGMWDIAISAADFRLSQRFCANGPKSLSFPQARSDLVNVYGFYNAASKEHFYSLDPNEGTHAGFAPTGTAFRVLRSPVPGTRPVYRCMIRNGRHFASADTGCEGQVREGQYGFVYVYQADGTLPLFREYQPSIGDHFITSNPVEGIVNGGFYIEGILGNVP